MMPTFIDESGRFGWDEHSSKHFTLTAVWFETSELAITCEKTIADLRANQGLSPDHEFKFTKSSHALRMAFLEAVSVCTFRYVTCTLLKWRGDRWLEGRMWRKRAYFYEKVIEPVVVSLKEYLLIAEACKEGPLNEPVTFDEHTDPKYRDSLRDHFFRPKAPSGRSLVKKVREGRSERDSLVQLADMVCGSFAHSLEPDSEYINLLEKQKIDHLIIP